MPEGHHREFLKHFLPVEGLLRAYFTASVRNASEADDLLQEVSSTLWEKFAEYDRARPFKAWAMGIARLEVLKWRQRLARSKEVLSPEALEILAESSLEHSQELDERRSYLDRCIDSLSGTARRALDARYASGKSIASVAEILGKSAAAVEMLFVRIRRALRKCVEEQLARARGGAR